MPLQVITVKLSVIKMFSLIHTGLSPAMGTRVVRASSFSLRTQFQSILLDFTFTYWFVFLRHFGDHYINRYLIIGCSIFRRGQKSGGPESVRCQVRVNDTYPNYTCI